MNNTVCNENFEATEGLALLWELTSQPDNIVFHSPDAELEGMQYFESEYRWLAVIGSSGTITVTVPRAGTFYPAVVVYDRQGNQKVVRKPGFDKKTERISIGRRPGQGGLSVVLPSYEMSIDGKVVGRFALTEGDNRQRLFFLNHPVAFKGGERITIRVGPEEGTHITEDILLLRTRPPLRKRNFAIGNVETGFVLRDGQEAMRLTWITSWPARCTVHYGSASGRMKRVTEREALANHRVYLTGLEPGAAYRFRIHAPGPDGSEMTSEEKGFTFSAPGPVQGTAVRTKVALRVENPYGFPVEGCPVTSGVPFAKGDLGDVRRMRLLGPGGRAVPMQAVVTRRWDDGSVKWALVSFRADARAGRAGRYTLEYGKVVSGRARGTSPVVEEDGDRLRVSTGPLEAVFDRRKSGFPVGISLNGRRVLGGVMEACIQDGEGRAYTSNGPAEILEVEEAGPVRVVVRSAGHHRSASRKSFFAYEARFVFYAGSPMVRVYYSWGNDREALFSHFRRACVRVPLAGGGPPRWSVGLGEGERADGGGDLELRQLRHDAFELDPVREGSLRRADGWLEVTRRNAGLTLAVRDFWQLYPRSLGVREGCVEAGVSAGFPEGFYDGADMKEAVNYYFYLLGGAYKIKRGVKKWHELGLYFHDGSPDDTDRLRAVSVFNEPLIATCPPERYCGTRVFGPLLPSTDGRTAWYDEACEKGVAAVYEARCEAEGWYGMLNFGDALGDENVTWLNGEYDHHHAFLLQYARTGQRRWYFLAEKAARHAIDVDTCHYGPDKGVEWAHALGHTGDYLDHDPLDSNNIPGGMVTPSHSWVEGFSDWHFLSGDPTALENAGLVGDYYAGAYLNNYDFENLRDIGWHLILTMGAYNLTGDPFYLNTARIIVERALERQTPGPRGWHRQMIPAHCYCTPRHRGACVYMLAILCRGLETYLDATGDPRLVDAIVGGAEQCVDEMWVERTNSFIGTSCPAGRESGTDLPLGVADKRNPERVEYHPLFMGIPCQTLLFAHLHAGRPEYVETVRRNMAACFGYGYPSVASFPWWSKVLYYLNEVDPESLGRP